MNMFTGQVCCKYAKRGLLVQRSPLQKVSSRAQIERAMTSLQTTTFGGSDHTHRDSHNIRPTVRDSKFQSLMEMLPFQAKDIM